MFWILASLLLLFQSVSLENIMVLKDIRNAFRAVTNDSELLDQIIPEMYGPPMRDANPAVVFKMPIHEHNVAIGGGSDGFEMLTMCRSDFAEPIFPNISQIPLKLEAASELHLKSTLSEAPQIEWLQLGLEGWRGELLHPEPVLEQSHKESQHESLQSGYPHEEILLDLQHHKLNGRIKDIRIITDYRDSAKQAELEDLRNAEHVYIARVNDPFGYSMKWTLNNDTTPSIEIASNGDNRSKRDVARLYSMIKCSTGCDPLIYKGYGCYCGLGGHGTPADGIDRCCRVHDKCYSQTNCISYLQYFVPYVWKCYRGKPLCAVDHGEWGGPDSCASRLCKCDLQLSRCLRKFYCPRRRSVCYSSRTRRLQNLVFFD